MASRLPKVSSCGDLALTGDRGTFDARDERGAGRRGPPQGVVERSPARSRASLSRKRPSYRARPTMQAAIGKAARRARSSSGPTPPDAITGVFRPRGQRLGRGQVRPLEHPVAGDVGVDDRRQRQVVELLGQGRRPRPRRRRASPPVATRPSRASSPRTSRPGYFSAIDAEPGRVLQRLGPDDHPLEPGVEPGRDRRLVADAPAELAGDLDPVEDRADRLDVDRPARLGAVEVDQVDAGRPLPTPSARPSPRGRRRRPSPGRSPPAGGGRSARPAGRWPGSLA